MSAGILDHISFAKESTWGTPVTPTKSLGVKFTGGIVTDNATILLNDMRNQFAKDYAAIIGARKHTGSFEMDLFADYPAYFFLSALGGVTSTVKGGETIVYTHTFVEALGSNRASLTLEQAQGELVQRYAGTLVDSFEIDVKEGSVATLKVSTQSQSVASATGITPTYTTVKPFSFKDFIVKVGGSTLGEVANININYKNNLEMGYAVGTNDPAYNTVKGSEISGKITLYLDSTTLTQYNNYLANTSQSVEIIGTGAAIGVSSNYGLDLLIPTASLTKSSVAINDSFNMLEIDFDGYYSTVTSQLVSLIVTNTLTALT